VSRPSAAALALVLLLALPGCMYHVRHELPVDATFGDVQEGPAERTAFRSVRVKRYLLAGTLPWSFSYNGSRKLTEGAPGRRIEDLEIRTRFSPIDALLRFVPYLSYVLNQRTVEVSGVYVDPSGDASGAYGVEPVGRELEAGELEGR
jgi:hypothetical protein